MKKEILSSTYPSKLNKRFRFYHGGFLIKKKIQFTLKHCIFTTQKNIKVEYKSTESSIFSRRTVARLLKLLVMMVLQLGSAQKNMSVLDCYRGNMRVITTTPWTAIREELHTFLKPTIVDTCFTLHPFQTKFFIIFIQRPLPAQRQQRSFYPVKNINIIINIVTSYQRPL